MTLQKQRCDVCMGIGRSAVTGICGFCLGSGHVYQSQPFSLPLIPRSEWADSVEELERHKNGSGAVEKKGEPQ